jgi:transposase
MRVRDALGVLFRDEDFLSDEFEGMYSPLGQPGLSPALLLLVTILQFMHNLSDREAAQAVADRISWKYMLGLALDDGGFDASVLSEFRARLAVGGRADRLLSVMLERLKAAGLVRAGGRQRTDATHVLAAVRRLNRIEQVGESLRAALEEIARIHPTWLVPLLQPGWDERYGRKVESSRLLKRKNASAVKLAEQIGADGRALLDAIQADPVTGWMNDLPQVQVLRTMWAHHYDQTGSGRLRWKETAELPPAAERIQSPYDPDARYSTKRDMEWVGSKAHLSESCDEDLPSLITDVHTTAATDPDVTATTPIQEKLVKRGLAPSEHLLDAGYPSADAITRALEVGITMISPLTVTTGRNATKDTFPPSAFTLDWDAGTATCPAGATSRPARPEGRGLVVFPFSARDCRPCPLRPQCTLADPSHPRKITVHPRPVWETQIRAQQAQTTTEWRTTYNQRAGVEGTISQAVRGPDLRHARYRGMPKIHLQNVLTGIALNVLRLGAYFDPHPTPERRPTRIHALCTTHGLAAA